jgi:hypothetical protein
MFRYWGLALLIVEQLVLYNKKMYKLPGYILLDCLTLVNILIYMDRGSLSVIINELEKPEQLNITDTQAGLLGSFLC